MLLKRKNETYHTKNEEEKYQKHKKFKINIKYKDIYDKEYQDDFDIEARINIQM